MKQTWDVLAGFLFCIKIMTQFGVIITGGVNKPPEDEGIMKKIINKRYKITALLKLFIKKEKNVDLISELKEIDKETGNPFKRIFTGSDSICLPVKEANEEVR